jgi:hypothetical protein
MATMGADFPQRAVAVVVFCTPYSIPAQQGKPHYSHQTTVRSRAPSFGYQLFLKSDEAPAIMTGPALDGFLSGCFSRKVQDRQAERYHRPGYAADAARVEDDWSREGKLKTYLAHLAQTDPAAKQKDDPVRRLGPSLVRGAHVTLCTGAAVLPRDLSQDDHRSRAQLVQGARTVSLRLHL